jgi:hypothetical protein
MQYGYQCFWAASRTRIREARHLLAVQSKRFDGAITVALLATECALKALLFFGHQQPSYEALKLSLPGVFEGKTGHCIAFLWNKQVPHVQASATADVSAAIDVLHQLDRFDHRYGRKVPSASACSASD